MVIVDIPTIEPYEYDISFIIYNHSSKRLNFEVFQSEREFEVKRFCSREHFIHDVLR